MEKINFTTSNIQFIITVGVLLFAIFKGWNKPQNDLEKVNVKLREDVDSLAKAITEIKETHIRSVEQDIKALNTSINELSKTVVKLATIIDERIPKANTQPS